MNLPGGNELISWTSKNSGLQEMRKGQEHSGEGIQGKQRLRDKNVFMSSRMANQIVSKKPGQPLWVNVNLGMRPSALDFRLGR